MEAYCIFPAETVCHILGYSSPRDIVRWRAVSKWFRDTTYDPSIWKNLYANSSLFRPPGPFPFQSTAYLEQALVRAEKLAQSWTTRPMRVVSRVELRTKRVVFMELLNGRWLVGCERWGKRIIAYDINATAPQKQVIWQQEETVKVGSWALTSIVAEDGQLVLYLLFSEIRAELEIPVWKLLELRLNDESDNLCSAAIFDAPKARADFDFAIRGGKSPFLYIWDRSSVFDTRTHTFYEFPEPCIALDETWYKIGTDFNLSGSQPYVVLTRTHIIVIRKYPPPVAVVQAFTIDGASVRNNKKFLRLSHEGTSNHIVLSEVTLLRNSVVDPVSGATNVRLVDRGLDDHGRVCIVFNDLTLPESTGNNVLPIAIIEDKKTTQTWHEYAYEKGSPYCFDYSDTGHLRGFYMNFANLEASFKGRFDGGFSVLKFAMDATRDEPTLSLKEFLCPEPIHIESLLCLGNMSFDGARGRLCFAKSVDDDESEQVVVVVDVE